MFLQALQGDSDEKFESPGSELSCLTVCNVAHGPLNPVALGEVQIAISVNHIARQRGELVNPA